MIESVILIAVGSVVGGLVLICLVVFLVLRLLRGTGGLGFGAGKDFVNAPLAIGTVVSAKPTGVSVNDVPQMAVVLDVDPPDGAPFRAQAKQMLDYSDMTALRPGSTVPVRYLADSSGSYRVQIASNVSEAEFARVLSQVKLARGEISSTQQQAAEHGRSDRAVVLEMRPTGEVRGDSSVLQITVQVNPEDGEPFTATIAQPVHLRSLPLVQVGAVVTVHHLPGHPDDLLIQLPAQ